MNAQWFNVYSEIAKLVFSKFRDEKDPGNALFNLLISHPNFVDENNTWLDRIVTNQSQCIDPIHLFASFNASNLTEENRMRKINIILKILGSISFYRKVDFLGCPTPRMIYINAPRNPTVVAEIWQVFINVMQDGKSALSQSVFSRFKSWYGVDIPSFTIFLFWIDSDTFLSLDKNTVNYLMSREVIKTEPKNYREYAALLENHLIENYRVLSITALGFSPPEKLPVQLIVKERKTKPEIRAVNTTFSDAPTKDFSDCRIVGVYLYEQTDRNLRKVLEAGEYFFYKAFQFDHKKNCISFSPEKDLRIYHQEGLSINISAIVGENGSGKSTLCELIFIALNNLSKKSKAIPAGKLTYVEGLNMDLFVISGSMYKIMFREEITIERYHYNTSQAQYDSPTQVTLDKFSFEQFFYTIAVNYAQYGLNSLQVGSWIRNMFYKNDQYQVPITLTPFRDEGNININRENDLLSSRLLANLLMPTGRDDEKNGVDNVRKLTHNKYAQKISLRLNREKLKTIYKDKTLTIERKDLSVYWKDVLTQFTDSFKLTLEFPQTVPKQITTYEQATWIYIVKKIINIAANYWQYSGFFDPVTNTFIELKVYLDRLATNYTHVTHKLFQAIHFLKFDHISKYKGLHTLPFEITLADLSDDVFDAKSLSGDERLDLIHFLPPSFFKVEVVLTGDINFDSLSSGQKQKIYSINSIIYHLKNIDSISSDSGLIPYRFVNVIFDEVELYFHPEMQKNYIDYFLNYLKLVKFKRLSGLNVLFITHSPFILSDIPADNILFLGGADHVQIRTLGANIHQLLAESFFLKSFMGDYARKNINDLIDFYTLKDYVHNDTLRKEPWNDTNAFNFINRIGEPLIRERLLDLHEEKFNSGQDTVVNALMARIKELEDEKNKS
ncbi:hypothetical protein OQY15_09715 [Pedobacter sp. MC2016-15]|uniref:AAA family ATPase n=1 Tax=Pedobacter sp. MC2016-15 TaxID=2994473 RepID=UPI0022465212|nr:hypothetical protein [Pedobacter sp. MC2016-15]MCX2479366.1 hypothetical protein [Pedobacter sp. MC2016-15]